MMKNKMYQSPEMDFKFFCTRDDILNISFGGEPEEDFWKEGELGDDENI